MKVIAVQNAVSTADRSMIEEMHRMRARIFKGRLGWQVTCHDGLEFDEFDLLNPTYILAIGRDGVMAGSVRLLPSDGPTMLARVFPQLLATGHLETHAGMIESSRFCVDTSTGEGAGSGVHDATRFLFAGIIEWGLMNGYTELATATDLRLERLLRRCGWSMNRLGSPCLINETQSVAGILPLTDADFQRQRPERYRSQFHRQQIENHRSWMTLSNADANRTGAFPG